MYTLTLEHHFSSAHQLTHAYDNKCNDSIHGHNWKVRISISTVELINGMVIDFTELKEIIDTLDHATLLEKRKENEQLLEVLRMKRNKVLVLEFEPTAENLARYIHNQIALRVGQVYRGSGATPHAIKVTLWEADKASITYSL